jgi:hypothetical protein
MRPEDEGKKSIMNLKKPINENYAATVVEIKNIIQLENCDNVVHTSIFGNLVVVGKDTKIGHKGIFFPVETALSPEYLHNNNLYRDNTLNKNINEKGYFEEHGRVKCAKFRGNKSEGLFMPMASLLHFADGTDVASLQLGDTFDQINGVPICQKHVPKIQKTEGTPGSRKDIRNATKKINRIVAGQFKLHQSTAMLGKNLHLITPDSVISITNKLHGTSFVAGKVLCKKKLNWFEKLLKWFGANLIDTHYDLIWSSRNVIKNDDLNKEYKHFYDEDVWALAAKFLEPFLLNGMSVYGEIVGYTPSGKMIQSGYDYGCGASLDDVDDGLHTKVFIYRITYTNLDGRTFEFSAKQVQDWCKRNNLDAVPEYYYGPAKGLITNMIYDEVSMSAYPKEDDAWRSDLFEYIMANFNLEKDCELCKNPVPAEGIVLRIEGQDYDAYKLKSFRFRERETKLLDKGEVDIESQESV